MAVRRRRRKRPARESDYDARGRYIGSNKASAWEKRKYGSNYKRSRTKRRRRSRNLINNPSSKALIAALVGAGVAAFAWKAYVNSRGEGAHFGDPVYMGVIGAGGVVGYLVGGKV